MVVRVLEDAHLLTHVVLWDAPVWLFTFKWSSLTTVTFKETSTIPKNVFPILRDTINLELIIEHRFLEGPYSEGDGLIHLPHLERPSVQRDCVCGVSLSLMFVISRFWSRTYDVTDHAGNVENSNRTPLSLHLLNLLLHFGPRRDAGTSVLLGSDPSHHPQGFVELSCRVVASNLSHPLQIPNMPIVHLGYCVAAVLFRQAT